MVFRSRSERAAVLHATILELNGESYRATAASRKKAAAKKEKD